MAVRPFFNPVVTSVLKNAPQEFCSRDTQRSGRGVQKNSLFHCHVDANRDQSGIDRTTTRSHGYFSLLRRTWSLAARRRGESGNNISSPEGHGAWTALAKVKDNTSSTVNCQCSAHTASQV